MEFLSELHPKIVHFPIALFVLYFVFETAGVIFNKEYISKSSLLILIIGVASAVLAVLTGNQAQIAAKILHAGNLEFIGLIEEHETFATATLWFFSILLTGRIYFSVKKKFSGRIRYLFMLLGFIGCILVYLSGVYGGNLVFDKGIGVHVQSK